jgi:hypothetical protein
MAIGLQATSKHFLRGVEEVEAGWSAARARRPGVAAAAAETAAASDCTHPQLLS